MLQTGYRPSSFVTSLGLEVGSEDGYLAIQQAFDGQPADQSNLLATLATWSTRIWSAAALSPLWPPRSAARLG